MEDHTFFLWLESSKIDLKKRSWVTPLWKACGSCIIVMIGTYDSMLTKAKISPLAKALLHRTNWRWILPLSTGLKNGSIWAWHCFMVAISAAVRMKLFANTTVRSTQCSVLMGDLMTSSCCVSLRPTAFPYYLTPSRLWTSLIVGRWAECARPTTRFFVSYSTTRTERVSLTCSTCSAVLLGKNSSRSAKTISWETHLAFRSTPWFEWHAINLSKCVLSYSYLFLHFRCFVVLPTLCYTIFVWIIRHIYYQHISDLFLVADTQLYKKQISIFFQASSKQKFFLQDSDKQNAV